VRSVTFPLASPYEPQKGLGSSTYKVESSGPTPRPVFGPLSRAGRGRCPARLPPPASPLTRSTRISQAGRVVVTKTMATPERPGPRQRPEPVLASYRLTSRILKIYPTMWYNMSRIIRWVLFGFLNKAPLYRDGYWVLWRSGLCLGLDLS
jgi:hypothetical protein